MLSTRSREGSLDAGAESRETPKQGTLAPEAVHPECYMPREALIDGAVSVAQAWAVSHFFVFSFQSEAQRLDTLCEHLGLAEGYLIVKGVFREIDRG